MTTYVVKAERDESMWHIRVPEIARSTCARTKDEIEPMARDLVSLMIDRKPNQFGLLISFKR